MTILATAFSDGLWTGVALTLVAQLATATAVLLTFGAIRSDRFDEDDDA